MSPGLIRSPTTERFWNDDKRAVAQKQAFFSRIPMERAGECDEVAELAAFLASGRAPYINGADIAIDGGLSGVSYGRYDQLPSNDAGI
jgi:NAD(P)-dependent dehydrogenase (short-subunit alcohol dehydrogenase family)